MDSRVGEHLEDKKLLNLSRFATERSGPCPSRTQLARFLLHSVFWLMIGRNAAVVYVHNKPWFIAEFCSPPFIWMLIIFRPFNTNRHPYFIFGIYFFQWLCKREIDLLIFFINPVGAMNISRMKAYQITSISFLNFSQTGLGVATWSINRQFCYRDYVNTYSVKKLLLDTVHGIQITSTSWLIAEA